MEQKESSSNIFSESTLTATLETVGRRNLFENTVTLETVERRNLFENNEVTDYSNIKIVTAEQQSSDSGNTNGNSNTDQSNNE